MPDNTRHVIHIDDARTHSVEPDSIDLVVTSPPYPMIEMWDYVFEELNSNIGAALAGGRGGDAFSLMHDELDEVWERVAEGVVDGGIVCVNIGDATRSIGGSFQSFPNTARIITAFQELGFHVLPRIYWQKPTNRATSFMGSGTLPPNAYPTAEHEHILVFRNGESRDFEPKDERRYESAYFFEERNTWFADHWTDVHGVSQALDSAHTTGGDAADRDRSAAFPLSLPYRLINMFSLYDDVVFDPFVGTGTTTVAAMLAGRNSVGVEVDGAVARTVSNRVQHVSGQSHDVITQRIDAHQKYLKERDADGKDAPSYSADHYPFDVVTSQEQGIRFYEVSDVVETGDSDSGRIAYEVSYDSYDGGVPVELSRFSGSHIDATSD